MLSLAQNTFYHNPRLRGPVSSSLYVHHHGNVSMALDVVVLAFVAKYDFCGLKT